MVNHLLECRRWLFVGLLFIVFSCDLTPVNDLSYTGNSLFLNQAVTEKSLKQNSYYPSLIIKLKSGKSLAVLDSSSVKVFGQFKLLDSYFVLAKANEGTAVTELLRELSSSEDVAWVEPNYKRLLSADIPFSIKDPYAFSFQYSTELTRLKESLNTNGLGGNKVSAAFIDTGINFLHEEFSSGFVTGYSFFSRSPSGDSIKYSFKFGNTYLGSPSTVQSGFMLTDLQEMDVNLNWDNLRGERHGSHVAGILGAKGGNDKGICGACPSQLNLISFKSFAGSVTGSTPGSGSAWACYSPLYLLMKEVDDGNTADNKLWKELSSGVIQKTYPVNMSFGWFRASKFESEMVSRAAEKGILCIAAAGNSSIVNNTYPAAYGEVISVSAVNGRKEWADFSSGSWGLSVCAPGADIYSVDASGNTGYRFSSGTSMAAPFVTGLAAQMLTFDPQLSPAKLKTIIEDCAQDLGESGHDPFYGFGLVDVKKTIDKVKAGNIVSRYSEQTRILKLSGAKAASTEGKVVYLYKDGLFSSLAVVWKNGSEYTAHFSLLPAGAYEAKLNLDKMVKIVNFSVILPEVGSDSVDIPWSLE